MTAKYVILRDHRCEETNVSYKYQIFEAVNVNSMGVGILYRCYQANV